MSEKVEVKWQAPLNAREIVRYRIWRKAGKQWNAIGSTGRSQFQFTDSKPPAGAAVYAVTCVEYSGLESEKSSTVPVASADGKHLPPVILLRAETAEYYYYRGIAPKKLRYRHDETAHNYRTVECKDSLFPISWTLAMPDDGRYSLSARIRTPSQRAKIVLHVNGVRYDVFAGAKQYVWTPLTVDDFGRTKPADLTKGNNKIMLTGFDKTFLVDCLRLERFDQPAN